MGAVTPTGIRKRRGVSVATSGYRLRIRKVASNYSEKGHSHRPGILLRMPGRTLRGFITAVGQAKRGRRRTALADCECRLPVRRCAVGGRLALKRADILSAQRRATTV